MAQSFSELERLELISLKLNTKWSAAELHSNLTYFLKKSEIILWLVGVEFLPLIPVDVCRFLGEVEPAELKVRFLAEPDEDIFVDSDLGLASKGNELFPPRSTSSFIAVSDKPISDLTVPLRKAARFSLSSSSFCKTAMVFCGVWFPCAAFEQKRNIPVLEILFFQSKVSVPISLVRFFELMMGYDGVKKTKQGN